MTMTMTTAMAMTMATSMVISASEHEQELAGYAVSLDSLTVRCEHRKPVPYSLSP